MRRLFKRPLPPAVEAKLNEWSRELMDLLSKGDEIPDSLAAKYRWPPLKSIIVEETSGKCAYCESKIGQVYPGDVEHILPKKHFPLLRLQFANLTLACFECNNRKRDRHDPDCPLINPYSDEPDLHFTAVGTMIWHRFRDRRAELTERLLELNRKELIERRKERLESVRRLAERYVAEPDGLMKDLLRKELEVECAEQAEYSFIVRGYLRAHCVIAA